MEPLTVFSQKRSIAAQLIAGLNRPMLAVAALLHVGILALPLPPQFDRPKTPEDDLAQITLRRGAVVPSAAPVSPKVTPTVQPQQTIAGNLTGNPVADLSRPPRPTVPLVQIPTAVVTSTPTPTPQPTGLPTIKPIAKARPSTASTRPRPQPSASRTPATKMPASITPATTTSKPATPAATPSPSALPVPPVDMTPPPPPAGDTAATDDINGLTLDQLKGKVAQMRQNLPNSGSTAVYPNQLAQPNAFFNGDVASRAVAQESDCLRSMAYCWWQPQDSPATVLDRLQKAPFFAHLNFEAVPEGYGDGKLYHLVNKTSGQPTSYYITLAAAQGSNQGGKGTLVGFWVISPRALLPLNF